MGKINKPLNQALFNEAKAWDLPSVDEVLKDPTKTNALNRTSSWRYEPPEEEDEEIKPLTASDIEKIRQSAYEEGFKLGHREGQDAGYEEGLQSGRAKGLEEGTQQGLEQGQLAADTKLAELSLAWKNILEAFAKPLKDIENEVEKELMILSVKLAEAVIGVEVTQKKDILLKAISEGIKVLPVEEQRYQFQLNPDDLVLITEHFGEDILKQNNWQLIENPSMRRGGCEISTHNNAIDVSIERRSKDIFSSFLHEQGLSNDPRTA